jgi:hypothetical protein
MRELKFRVWDEIYYRWINGWMVYAENIKYNGLIFQQYVGIKDCTGKEIYEGDIICTMKDYLRLIVWSKEQLQWFAVNGDEELFPVGIWLNKDFPKLKVVGNYLENEKLFKKIKYGREYLNEW